MMSDVTYRPFLQWINNAQADSSSRVRAHVARERRHRKSWEEEQSMRILRSRRRGNKNALVSSRSEELERIRVLRTVHPELLGAGRKDPFASYPLQSISNEDLELLDHCK
jgi:hypothetical protein